MNIQFRRSTPPLRGIDFEEIFLSPRNSMDSDSDTPQPAPARSVRRHSGALDDLRPLSRAEARVARGVAPTRNNSLIEMQDFLTAEMPATAATALGSLEAGQVTGSVVAQPPAFTACGVPVSHAAAAWAGTGAVLGAASLPLLWKGLDLALAESGTALRKHMGTLMAAVGALWAAAAVYLMLQGGRRIARDRRPEDAELPPA